MIDKIIILIFKVFVYRGYRRKYSLPKDFKFNGYLIRLMGGGEIIAGSECYISYYSYINLQKGTTLTLGSKVSIGHNVKIYTSTFDTASFIEHRVKKNKLSYVKIGSNVLIGANVFICPGVTIGDDVIVGANSVVTTNIPSKSVFAGVPAKMIKRYSDE